MATISMQAFCYLEKSRNAQVPHDHEFSWRKEKLHGNYILPRVRHQGSAPTCVPHALLAATEMENAREHAEFFQCTYDGKLYRLDVHDFKGCYDKAIENFSHDFKEIEGVHAPTCLDFFKTCGAAVEGGKARVKISAWNRLDDIPFEKAISLISKGSALLGFFKTADDLGNLGPDEIYRLDPNVLGAKGGQQHMVVFVGYGFRGGEPYLVFLNSWGETFGDQGFGRIYFDQVLTCYTVNLPQFKEGEKSLTEKTAV